MNYTGNHTAVTSNAFASFVEEQAERADIGPTVIAYNINGGSIALCDTATAAQTLINRLAGHGIPARITTVN